MNREYTYVKCCVYFDMFNKMSNTRAQAHISSYTNYKYICFICVFRCLYGWLIKVYFITVLLNLTILFIFHHFPLHLFPSSFSLLLFRLFCHFVVVAHFDINFPPVFKP